MDAKELKAIIDEGESYHVEFISWKGFISEYDRLDRIVQELISFINAKGGSVYLGIEDDGTVTGCPNDVDTQALIEWIYGATIPATFASVESIIYEEKRVIVLRVAPEDRPYFTAFGQSFKRLGRVSKPYNPYDYGIKVDWIGDKTDNRPANKLVSYPIAREKILFTIRIYGSIKNEIVRDICGVNRSQAVYILGKMKQEGLLKIEKAGRSTRYVLA